MSALDPALVVDVAPDRRVRAGHGRRQDHASAATRIADRGAERAPGRVLGREPEAARAEAVDMQDGDVELGVEEDRLGVEQLAGIGRDPDGPADRAGHDVRVGDHVLARHREARPARGVAAGRRRDLDDARRAPPSAMAAAVGSSGRSTGAAGMGSKPTKTAGSPVASRTRPSSSAKSVGAGGRRRARAGPSRLWAASVRRGIGPTASSPPTSQRISTAWATPTNAPATRSAAPRTPVPSEVVRRRPRVEPIDSPTMTATRSATRTTKGRTAGSRPSMASMTSGRPRMTSAAPPTAPTRPPSCGSAPERKPRAAPTRSSTMAATSIGFTPPIVAQVSRTWVRRRTGDRSGRAASGQDTSNVVRRGPAAAVDDRVACPAPGRRGRCASP